MKNPLFIPLILFTSLFFLFLRNGLFNSAAALKPENEDSTHYSDIRFLDLSQRNLKELPSNISKYADLEVLDLSNNPLQRLDSRLLELRHLRVIKLNFCTALNIEQASAIIRNLPVEEVEMNNSALVYIPEELCMGLSLKKLSLRENYITQFPEELPLQSKLEYLDLAKNDVDNFPEEVNTFLWLTYLDISDNPCLKNSDICQKISELENLRILKMNGATSLTNDLAKLTELTELSIANSSVNSFPQDLSHLKILNVEGCHKLDYPAFFNAIKKCDSLEKLSLSSPKLQHLPAGISSLSQLKTLSIKENNIHSLPENFSDLKQLTELKIQLASGNANGIMRTLSSCKSLEKLDLSGSAITTLPENISTLRQLKSLSVESASITSAKELTGMNGLNELNVRGTKMDALSMNELKGKLQNTNIISDTPFDVPVNLQKELFAQNQTFTLSGSESCTVTTIDGSVIKIPANAFVDAKGKPVKGDITLSFQPFYSPAQIYLSGIPMNYDSGGVTNSFQSAGMFSISASSKGSDLKLAKQKRLQVDFRSINPKRNYNVYTFDRSTNNWTYKGGDNLQALRPSPKNDTMPMADIKAPRRPSMKPFVYPHMRTGIFYQLKEKKGRKEYVFWISRGFRTRKIKGVQENIKDELPDYVNRRSHWVYLVDSNVPDFFAKKHKDAPKIFGAFAVTVYDKDKRIMELQGPENGNLDIYVSPDRSKDRFNIVFKQGRDSVVLPAYPDYGMAMANRVQDKTKKQYEIYMKHFNARKDVEEKLMAGYRKEMEEYRKKMWEYREKIVKANKEYYEKLSNMNVTDDRITRTLMLDGLGVWNCDIISRLPEGMEILASVYNNNVKLKPESLTLIDQTNSGYASYPTSRIVVDRFANNVLIAKLSDGRYGYAKFSVNERVKDLDIALNIVDTKNMSMKEFTEKIMN